MILPPYLLLNRQGKIMETQEKQYLFSTHFYAKADRNDTIIVRDRVFQDDGSYKTRLFAIENYERPYYITKPVHRNHKQKKEFEHKKKLDKYYSTQSDLPNSINQNIKVAYRPILRDIKKSPYIYDVDTDVNVFISDKYREKYPDHIHHPLSVCAFDIETDVGGVTRHPNSIIMISMAMGKKVYVGVLEEIYKGMSAEQIHKAILESNDKYLKEKLKDKTVIIKVYKTEGGLLKNTFKGLHNWNPDILNIFNMNFDIPKVIEAAARNDIRMEDLFHSPQLHDRFKFFKYHQGPSIKRKSDGTEHPLPYHHQWHTVQSSAGFIVLDSMCSYKQVRFGGQELSSFSLDHILGIELGERKLKFKETDHLVKKAWHVAMQTKYPVEYASYSLYDSLGLVELDEKTFDLNYTLYASMTGLPYSYVSKRSARVYHMYRNHILKSDLVPSCGYVYDDKAIRALSPEDRHILGLDGKPLDNDGWIVTVSAGNNQEVGLSILKNNPCVRTGIRTNSNDDDVKAAYPSGMDVFNTSKSTTDREIIEIEGLDEDYYRPANMGVLLGPSYHSLFPMEMYQYPDFDQLLKK